MFIFVRPPDWDKLPLSKKIQHYMIQLDKDHAYYVDKLLAKQIVKDMGGDEIEIPKTIRILKDYTDITESDINANYMIKASHGSSWNINITPNTNLTVKSIINTLSSWNCRFNGNLEKQYDYISPRFYIEEKITCRYQGHNGNAYAWCFYCAHNKVFLINVIDKGADYINRYDLNWNLYKIDMNGSFNVEKPRELQKMIQLAEKLSKPFEFVRVDFYIGNDNKIYFSEFTFSPCMGLPIYGDYDYELAKYWK